MEIDVFENNGSWISEILSPNPDFGWGSIDGLVKQPLGTNVTFDLLDIDNNIIAGYDNRILPIDVQLDAGAYPKFRVKVNLETSNNLVSPSVELLSIGGSTYFDSYHLQNIRQNDIYFGQYDDFYLSSDFQITTQQPSFFNIQVPSYCPHIGAIMTSFGDNISLHSSTFNLDSTYYDEDINFRQMNFSNDGRISQSLSDEIQITLLSGQEFTRFSYTPICAEAPENPSVFLGEQNEGVFSWSAENLSEHFGMTKKLSHISSGDSINSNNNYSLELNLTDGQIVEVSYRVLDSITPSNPSTNNHIAMSMLVELSSQSNSSLNYFSIISQLLTQQQTCLQPKRYQSPDSCPNLSFPDGEIYQVMGWQNVS